MRSVLLRNFPELAPALRGVTNAFQPWSVTDGVPATPADPEGARRWKRRRGFWDGLAIFKFRNEKPSPIPAPTPDDRPVRLVPFLARSPRYPVHGVMIGHHVPADEAEKVKTAFSRLQALLDRWYPPMQRGMPPVDASADAA